MTGYACSCRCGEISRLITDQKARSPIDRPTPQQVEDHPRRRLAPVAVLTIAALDCIGMIRTISNVVKVSARSGELCRKVGVHRAHIIFRVETARDPGLIGDDEHK